jgi:hypothetical protein
MILHVRKSLKCILNDSQILDKMMTAQIAEEEEDGSEGRRDEANVKVG